MTYDSARQCTVLFGGSASNVALADTWEWNGKMWIPRINTVYPPGRSHHAMAYDSARRRTVLFAGTTRSLYLADTWEYDGKTWTQIKTSTSPSVRIRHAMAYDSARRRIVLFGGRSSSYLGDTWEYDGKTWTQIKTTAAPRPREHHAMVYDSARRRTVLVGGWPTGRSSVDTWEWDGKTWTEIKPTTSPSERFSHAMTYDLVRRRTVMFGGWIGLGTTASSETWEWDGKNWMLVKPANSPPARHSHAMAYDSERQRNVLFGRCWGTTGSLADTWEYEDLGRAQFKPYGASCGPLLAAAKGSSPTIGMRFTMVTSNLPAGATTALMSAGATDKYIGAFPLPLQLDFLGMKNCFLYHSFNAAWIFPVANGTGSFSVQVPGNTVLVGTRVYFQAAAGSVTSNGGGVLISNR